MSSLKFTPGGYMAIDCGTGSIRSLAIKVEADGEYEVVLNESREHEIGRDLSLHKALTPETIDIIIRSTKEFLAIAEELGVKHVSAAATESLRAAANGPEILQRLATEAIPFKMLSGLDELQTSLMGVLPYLKDIDETFYFADSGGGSTEVGIINADDFSIIVGDSLPVGVSSLGHQLEALGDVTAPMHMEETVTKLTQIFGEAMANWSTPEHTSELVVAGAPMHLFRYARKIHGSSLERADRVLNRQEVEQAAAEMAAMGLTGRRAHPYIDGKGSSFLLPCSLKILALMNVTGIETVRIVPSGICAGLCLQAAYTETDKAAS